MSAIDHLLHDNEGYATRFPGPAQLCSWAGLTPLHRESDTKVHRGRITKQGNTLVRWAAVEAVQRTRDGLLARARARISDRRGNNIGKVATARKLLTLGLLRATRRTHPRRGPQAGRVSTIPAQPARAVELCLTPTRGWRGRAF